jgi:hypothetical protein
MAIAKKPKITRAKDTSALKNILAGRSGVGKTFFASTIPNVFILAIEEGMKGCSPDHEPAHFEDDDLPQTIGDLLGLLDSFMEQNQPVDGARPWTSLVLDSMTGIEKLACASAMKQHKVSDMDGKEYKAVWATAFERMRDVQDRLDKVRKTGVHIWILAHAVESYEAVAETGATFKRWDMQFRGAEKTVTEAKLLWRSWADSIYMMDRKGTVENSGKGSRAVGKLSARVLYTTESGTHFAKARLRLPPIVNATWEDLNKAIRAGVSAPEAKLRADITKLLPALGEHRSEIETSLLAATGTNTLTTLLSRAQGLVAILESEREEDDGTEGGETAPISGPPAPPSAPSVMDAAAKAMSEYEDKLQTFLIKVAAAEDGDAVTALAKEAGATFGKAPPSITGQVREALNDRRKDLGLPIPGATK